ALDPIINGAATDAQDVSDPLHGLPCSKPEEGLDAAMFLGEGPISQETLQVVALLVIELQKGHHRIVVNVLVAPWGSLFVQELVAACLVVRIRSDPRVLRALAAFHGL